MNHQQIFHQQRLRRQSTLRALANEGVPIAHNMINARQAFRSNEFPPSEYMSTNNATLQNMHDQAWAHMTATDIALHNMGENETGIRPTPPPLFATAPGHIMSDEDTQALRNGMAGYANQLAHDQNSQIQAVRQIASSQAGPENIG